MAMGRRRLLGLLGGLMIGCTRAPSRTAAPKPSPFSPVDDVCVCALASAEAQLARAMHLFAGESPPEAPARDFGTCSSGFAGAPSVAAPDDVASAFSVPERARALAITPEGDLFFCDAPLHATDAIALRPVAAAFAEALLAQQLCYATALAVALDAKLTGGPEEPARALVRQLGERARRADALLAMSITTVAVLSEATARRIPEEVLPFTAEQLRGVTLEGSFASDGALAFKRAAHLTQDVSAALRRVHAAQRLKPRPPLRISGTPWPGLLVASRKREPARGISETLVGLAKGDVGMCMTGASGLYADDSDAALALDAVTHFLVGDFRGGMALALELVPYFSDAAGALSQITERLA